MPTSIDRRLSPAAPFGNRALWRLRGLLIVALKLVDYRYLVLEHSVEMYGALVAALFAGVDAAISAVVLRKK